MIGALFRFILPTREIITCKRTTLDTWQFSVAQNGWFAKHRDVEIYELDNDGLRRLDNDAGWQIVWDDDELVIYFREHIAREQRAFEQMVDDCTE